MSTESTKRDGKVPNPTVEQSNNELVIGISGPGSCVSQKTSEGPTETEVHKKSVTKGTVSKVTNPDAAFTSNELGAAKKYPQIPPKETGNCPTQELNSRTTSWLSEDQDLAPESRKKHQRSRERLKFVNRAPPREPCPR